MVRIGFLGSKNLNLDFPTTIMGLETRFLNDMSMIFFKIKKKNQYKDVSLGF
jgi:hypothetical protein